MTGWIERHAEVVFVPHRRELHLARVGRQHTLCARQAERRERRRGDDQRPCRVCRQSAQVAAWFDTREMPTRWAIRNREVRL